MVKAERVETKKANLFNIFANTRDKSPKTPVVNDEADQIFKNHDSPDQIQEVISKN